MALDVGRKRIGVALSDPSGLLAYPLTTIERSSQSVDIDSVLSLAAEHDAEEIVVGLPLSLSGEEGPQARQVARFIEGLTDRAVVGVRALDERYSTVEAERLMRQAGEQPSRDRARVDAVAATVILQAYLDSKKATPEL